MIFKKQSMRTSPAEFTRHSKPCELSLKCMQLLCAVTSVIVTQIQALIIPAHLQ